MLHQANLKAQHETMRDEYHPPLPPFEFDEAAKARLEKFKQHQKQESLYTIFCGKCFGAR
jgi:hypothetical protein